MKKNYYIFKAGRLRRKDNTLYYELKDENEKNITLPIESIKDIYIFGKSDFNTDCIEFLNKFNINLHIFDYYGNSVGSYITNKELLAGNSTINQVKKFSEHRLMIAKEFLYSAKNTIKQNIMEYGMDYSPVENIDFSKCNHISALMGYEANIRKYYYSQFDNILKSFKFEKRTKQPPKNEINALISFGNTLCYSVCLKSIRKTQLDSTISFLHEPGARKHSLSLDIAEIFKPLYVDRLIFKLINNNMITKKHFIKNDNFCFLNEQGKKIFLKEWEEKLKTTIRHDELNRNVSYNRLIDLECYKLLKFINEDEEYEALKMKW
jgi:CRISPR-associated protein Cas1